MNRLRNVLICLLAGLSLAQAQSELNAYKYLIVPTRYENFRQSNQYNTSTLTKYHLTQMGYPAVYDNGLPKDLRVDPCLGLMLSLAEEASMFRTQIKFVFTDCEGRVVYQTREGASKSKDFQEIYKEAIPDALRSLMSMTYAYQPREGAVEAAPAESQEVVSDETEQAAPEETEEAAPAESQEVVPDEPEEAAPTESTELLKASGILYAHPIANGYQLVDSTPAVRMILLNSSRPDNYLVMVNGTAKGTVFKEGDTWWHEYIEGNVIFKKELQVKF